MQPAGLSCLHSYVLLWTPFYACRGGLRFGVLAGLFDAVQQVSSIARAEKGLPDVIIAGTATGAAFGATGVCQAFQRQTRLVKTTSVNH